MIYRFADLELDVGRRQLRRGDKVLELSRLSLDVLLTLVEQAPDLVSYDKIIHQAWGPKRIVTPENLTQRVMMLRRALGDDAKEPVYIDAVRGQGLRLIPEVQRVASPTRQRYPVGHNNKRRVAALAVVLILAAVGYLVIRHGGAALDQQREGELAPSAITAEMAYIPAAGPALAVLPFVNMSGNPANEYLGDGIAEEIINELVQQTPLPVVARTSSFQFKGQQLDGRDIAERLDASHLLEGSVRKSDQRIRITAQLVDVSTGYHLWSEQYDRPLADMLDIQTEIAVRIVDEIQRQLQNESVPFASELAGPVSISGRGSTEPAAYEAYLQGLQHLHRALPNDLALALAHFERATQLDPGFFAAWKSLIDAQLLATSFPLLLQNFRTAYDRIEEWLAIARPLHPDSAYLDMVAGAMRALNHFEWKQGLARMERALPRLQDDAEALAFAGMTFLTVTYQELGAELLERAYLLDPHSPSVQMGLSWALFFSNRHKDAIELLDSKGNEYIKAATAAQIDFAMADVDELVRHVRIARRYVDADFPAMRSLETLLTTLRGDEARAREMSETLFEQMAEQPIMLGWGPRSEERVHDLYELSFEQRQPVLVFWALDPTIPKQPDSPLFHYIERQNLHQLPRDKTTQLFVLNEAEREAVLSSELQISTRELERFLGNYGSGFRAISIELRDDRLYYSRRYFEGSAAYMGNNTFKSLLEPDMQMQFFENESGEIDLCVWRWGQMTHYSYRRKQT